MERITITVDEDILEAFDAFMARNGYRNRSEAFRDLLREKLSAEDLRDRDRGNVVGCLSYVYDHASRDLATRMISAQHAHHDLTMATLHVHLDHDNCLETAVLRGPLKHVRSFAAAVCASTGVRHGNLHLVPVSLDNAGHHHDGADEETAAPHAHSHPHA